jgi:hypothetical protein
LRFNQRSRVRHVRNSSGDDHFPVTIASITITSIADAINITAIVTDAGRTERAVGLWILSAQFEWIVDATEFRHRKRRDDGRPRRENYPGYHGRRNRSRGYT